MEQSSFYRDSTTREVGVPENERPSGGIFAVTVGEPLVQEGVGGRQIVERTGDRQQGQFLDQPVPTSV
jgi:hypothetical protein